MSHDSLDDLYRDPNPNYPLACNCDKCTKERLVNAGLKSPENEVQKLEQDVNLFLKYKDKRLSWYKRLLAMLRFDFREKQP